MPHDMRTSMKSGNTERELAPGPLISYLGGTYISEREVVNGSLLDIKIR